MIRPLKENEWSDDHFIRHLFLDGDVDSLGRELESFIIPCGKCIGCRLDYSREWSDRCYLHSLTTSPNWFITLTYDDLNLPINEFVDEDGATIYVNSLVKSHLSEFMKRLRSYYDYHFDIKEFSFYSCGEYGSRYSRPHYHLLLFGVPIPDLEVFTFKDGFVTYNSKIFSDCWKKGFVTVNEFSYETASYVARYCLKKQYGEDKLFYESKGLLPEFSLMSRNPGIGYDYFKLHKDEIFKLGYVPIKKSGGIYHSPIPKYYERCLEKEDPLLFASYKSSKKADSFDRFVYNYHLSSSELPMLNQLEVSESVKLNQIKALRRQFESSYNCI